MGLDISGERNPLEDGANIRSEGGLYQASNVNVCGLRVALEAGKYTGLYWSGVCGWREDG